MKPKSQFLPPRQWAIYAATRRMLDETALNAQSFAMAVAERYIATTAPDVRQVKFRIGSEDDARHNAQILRRYMDGTLKTLPADLEDAWVLALPEPYRSACENDLARRRGRLSVVMPECAEGEDAAAMSQVMTHAGAMCAAWGRSLEDGRIDPRSPGWEGGAARLTGLRPSEMLRGSRPAGRGSSLEGAHAGHKTRVFRVGSRSGVCLSA